MKEKVGGLKRDLYSTKIKLDIHKWFGKSVEFKKYIYMEYVMQEVEFCLRLGRVHTV